MSKILDPWTHGYLTTLGIAEGWHCLELGGGNGSITEWLAAKVGCSGSVTAIDINPVLLELIAAQNLSVQQMDLRSGELGIGIYDLVTCRAMLHQIAEDAPQVLSQMADAVRPGGWLWSRSRTSILRRPPSRKHGPHWEGLIDWGHPHGVDWLIGRKLPSMVGALGLGHPRRKPTCRTSVAGIAERCYFQLFFAEVRDRVIGAGQLDAATIDAASALLDDPNYWTQCWMMTAVWARKPQHDDAARAIS